MFCWCEWGIRHDSYCSYQIETQNQTTQNERLADQKEQVINSFNLF